MRTKRETTHQLLDERLHLVRGEADRVRREVAVRMVHIDVVPHRLERDARVAHRLRGRLGRVHRAVPPPAQVEAEAPQRLPRRQPDQRAVLLDDRVRRGPREEVHVERAADEPVLDERDGRAGWGLQERVRAGGAVGQRSERDARACSNVEDALEDEDTVRLRRARSRVVAVLQVEGMRAVPNRSQLARTRAHIVILNSHVPVYGVGGIARPVRLDGTRSTVRAHIAAEAGGGDGLANAIDISVKRES